MYYKLAFRDLPIRFHSPFAFVLSVYFSVVKPAASKLISTGKSDYGLLSGLMNYPLILSSTSFNFV